MTQSGGLALGDNIDGYYRSIFNHSDVIVRQSNRIRCKKRKIRLLRRSRSFKVIDFGINRKQVWDILLVINTNWHLISYRFGVTAAYCSNFGHCVFLATLWGLRDNVQCSSWDHWKARSGLPISVNWTIASGYCWGATGENRSKIADFAPTRSFLENKKLIRRWDSERDLSVRRHRTLSHYFTLYFTTISWRSSSIIINVARVRPT